jgi:glycosyltransferase involved in cell wall biosynthesis
MSVPVLFIAHHFPPMGGPGVHRTLNFVKYLRNFGYEPIVLTITQEDVERSSYPIDVSLERQLPSDLIIERTRNYEPRKVKGFLMKLRIFRFFWMFLYPIFWESSALWPFRAYFRAKNLIKKHNISLVYTTSGPYSSILIGYLLKSRLKVKWVADIRDPYTESFGWIWPTKLHWQFSKWVEKVLLSKVDELIVVTPEMKKMYVKRELLDCNKISVITNGF